MSSDRNRIAAVIVTALIIIAVIVLSRRSGPSPTQGDPTQPATAVWSLFDAQRRADVRAYLAQMDGEALKVAKQSVEETGRAAFADYLRKTASEVKAYAVRDVRQDTPDSATVVADLVYEDGQEEHRFGLTRTGGTWKIVSVVGGQRHPSLIRYGTPVTPLSKQPTAAANEAPGQQPLD